MAGHHIDVTSSTMPRAASLDRVRRARNGRRVWLVLLVGFVLLGALGTFGTRTGEVARSGGGYDVSVTYPTTSRPGHAVRFEVEVRKAGGFGGDPIRVRMLSDYFDLFDENGFSPAPDAETADADYDYLELAAPPGDVLAISVDTRIEPARQRGTRGEVAVLDGSGAVVVAVPFRTRLWP